MALRLDQTSIGLNPNQWKPKQEMFRWLHSSEPGERKGNTDPTAIFTVAIMVKTPLCLIQQLNKQLIEAF